MARILFAWELGSNLGHLSRLLPVAKRLKTQGHSVLVAARDVAAAAAMLGPAGIPFVQAPQGSVTPLAGGRQAGYADLLWARGWADTHRLWGQVHAWINLFRMFVPDVIVFDHSPSGLLAAQATPARRVLIGTGFELPPLGAPLPLYPGLPGADVATAADAESRVLENANRVLRTLHAPGLEQLAHLFSSDLRCLTTVAELDPYGPRVEHYVGPLGALDHGVRLEWPTGFPHRVFAYLRPETSGFEAVLKVLSASDAAVICCAPGAPAQLTDPLQRPGFTLLRLPVQLHSLLDEASLCVSYAPAGTVASTLLRGVPQLLAPTHVEGQLTADRVERSGLGLTLRGQRSEDSISQAMNRLLDTFDFKARAITFAKKYRALNPTEAADGVANEIALLASRGMAANL